jgi:mutator protein MutT
MWQFPNGEVAPGEGWEEALQRIMREVVGVAAQAGATAGTFKHSVTRYRVTLRAFHVPHFVGEPAPVGCAECAWVRLEELADCGLPSVHRRLAEAVLKQQVASREPRFPKAPTRDSRPVTRDTGGGRRSLSSQSIIEVAIGVVRDDGRVLIARRPEGTHLAGLWEFPGGKVEDGETPAQCLVRELREEVGIEIAVGEPYERLEFVYPERRVRIYPFECRLLAGTPSPIGCAELRWVTPAELADYEFPPANATLLAKIGAMTDHRRPTTDG